jgi:crotonobetainyl-CoA:carnitine CoA-transferase CaiB-like acyl-CoA transferase
VIRVALTGRIRKTAAKLPPDLRAEAEDVIAAVSKEFGNPHKHGGIGALALHHRGIADAGAKARRLARPCPLPAQALDHASGYLLAFGIIRALSRRLAGGGSQRVRVSLARTGRWIEDLGRVDALDVADPAYEDVSDLLETRQTCDGDITHVRLLGL